MKTLWFRFMIVLGALLQTGCLGTAAPVTNLFVEGNKGRLAEVSGTKDDATFSFWNGVVVKTSELAETKTPDDQLKSPLVHATENGLTYFLRDGRVMSNGKEMAWLQASGFALPVKHKSLTCINGDTEWCTEKKLKDLGGFALGSEPINTPVVFTDSQPIYVALAPHCYAAKQPCYTVAWGEQLSEARHNSIVYLAETEIEGESIPVSVGVNVEVERKLHESSAEVTTTTITQVQVFGAKPLTLECTEFSPLSKIRWVYAPGANHQYLIKHHQLLKLAQDLEQGTAEIVSRPGFAKICGHERFVYVAKYNSCNELHRLDSREHRKSCTVDYFIRIADRAFPLVIAKNKLKTRSPSKQLPHSAVVFVFCKVALDIFYEMV